MSSKAKRLQEFLDRLEAAPPASSADEAFGLIVSTLNAVEDELSGVPFRPENWRNDGRLYPPQEDARVKYPEHPSLRKYRSKGHYNYIGLNGSIRIETLEAEILLDKPGRDGRRTGDLNA
ncbi:MAG TPA: hypothetical protein VGY56_19945 [Verrucomicrobiae bacterium]|nr:hypothetical protein [Verrucomicrobiae bacterium]